MSSDFKKDDFKKGDIVWVEPQKRDKQKLRHAAVVWSDGIKGDFEGIMLTHSTPSHEYKNILMAKEHFVDGYEYKFDNTHFVAQVFTKYADWGPFYKAGELTEEGIKFIEDGLTTKEQKTPIPFENYIKR
jgi:hypothetical protein